MTESGSLSVGLNVDIQRTDGRIHSAVISSLNHETKTVTVEWYERGESKGKEIDFQTIFKLNSDFAPSKEAAVTASVEEAAPTPVVQHRHMANPSGYSRNTMAHHHTSASTPAAPIKQQSVPPPQPVFAEPSKPAPVVTSKLPTTARVAPVPAAKVVLTPQPTLPTDDDDRTETEDLGYDKKGLKLGGRKSNCVKEIERIQQRRDERRAAQKAVKGQPEFDPSNPNYDFLMMIKDFQDTIDYNPISHNEPIELHQICVCVRKRPINKREMGRKEIDVITIPNTKNVIVHEPKLKVDLTKYLENQNFRYDYAFDEAVDNATVYWYTAKPLVDCIFEKGMATCFAYGQTGSGKTHTMGGEFESAGQQNYSGGIYALAATDVFRLIDTKYRDEDLMVQSAFFEIYGGKVFDLLNKKEKLRILEDHRGQVQIVGLKTNVVENVADVLNLLQIGNKSRTSGQTSANQHSSRSHAVFQIILKKRLTNKLWGKFSLIDLAGNERGADTCSADRNTRMEGAEINKSLLALKECIRALGRKGAHRPFRASKLTQVLRDSFIGANSRTCMISMISPGLLSCEHTLNTLRYADRVKELGPSGNAGGGADDTMVVHQAPQTAQKPPSHAVSASGDYDHQHGRVPARGQLPLHQHSNNNNYKVAGEADGYEEAGLDELEEEEYDDGDLDENDDLALVRSANAEFIDDEMFSFQELVNKIESLEDNVCDKHKDLVDNLTTQLKKHTSLFKMTKQPDYPLDEYANKLEDLLDDQLKGLTDFKNTVIELRGELKKEEEISNRLLANRDNQ